MLNAQRYPLCGQLLEALVVFYLLTYLTYTVLADVVSMAFHFVRIANLVVGARLLFTILVLLGQ